MTALKVEFVDELPGAGRKWTSSADIAAFAAELRKRPGRWAKYPWSDGLQRRTRIQRTSEINNHRYGAPSALRTGFEAAFRDNTMYVRYVGVPAVDTAAPVGASAGADLDPASPPPTGAVNRKAGR